ncbi:unnamed protein product [Moneuplotes crassus]|uniref:Uncharacterized protein n=1 Tax=Euplotes crassus TaxID=5936 RepID=A0AAD1U3Q8_EUPCR|nr:unnamed protein product [Moneuplotes crassus]
MDEMTRTPFSRVRANLAGNYKASCTDQKQFRLSDNRQIVLESKASALGFKENSDKNLNCAPRRSVFSYGIQTQSGSRIRPLRCNAQQGRGKKIGILKKQKAYRNLFVLLEPASNQQAS